MYQIYLVSGPTGAGKTTFSRCIESHIGGVLLAMDNYFFNLDQLETEYSPEYGVAPQCDNPSAIDIDLLLSNVQELFLSGCTKIPRYCFVEEMRKGSQTLFKNSSQPLIIDGIHAITFRNRFEELGIPIFSLYLDATQEIRFSRMRKRNIEERGDPEHLFEKQCHFIKLAESRWILRQAEEADLILNTNGVNGIFSIEDLVSDFLSSVDSGEDDYF